MIEEIPLGTLQGIGDALERVERVLAFDLRRMVTYGPDYNQAVREALDIVIATRRCITEEVEGVDRSEILPDCMMPDGGETCRGYLNQFGENMNMRRRLRRIEAIIEFVDNRCMATDGPVRATLQEMTQAEISQIYVLAKGDL